MNEAKAAIIAAIITAVATLAAAFIQFYQPLKQDNITLRQENAELQQENDALSDLQHRLDVLNSEKAKLQADYEAQIDSLNQEIDQLNAELEKAGLPIATPTSTASDSAVSDNDPNDSTAIPVSGNHSGKPDAWLSDLRLFDWNGKWRNGEVTTDNLGIEHSHSIDLNDNGRGGGWREYVLDGEHGEYKFLTCVFYQEYNVRAQGEQTTLMFYGDGELLHDKVTVGRGIIPIPLEINIEGVYRLKIELSGTWSQDTAIGEVALWKS